jgi:DNA-binding FadR family transcriptional regulator
VSTHAYSPAIRALKRGDLVVEQIKRWITERNLRPGARLPKEVDLLEQFGVSRGTMREALKALEVQGLITLCTGPGGGATIQEVSLGRTFQFLQNYLFFQDVDIADIYAVRRLLEPSLASEAVPHLGEEHLEALERNIDCCAPIPGLLPPVCQREGDLHFHDILADACPNPLLRFHCKLINSLLRTLVVSTYPTTPEAHERLGTAAVDYHRRIVAAIRRQDAPLVLRLMLAHLVDTERHLRGVQAALRSRLVLDSEMRPRTVLPPDLHR